MERKVARDTLGQMKRDGEEMQDKTSATPMDTDAGRAAELFAESARIMARLRAPDGCPWDREQSFDTIRKYTLEEAYEVFDAIERRDFPHLAEELGDLLLQVLFYAEMAANEGHFTIADVLDHPSAVRRGDVERPRLELGHQDHEVVRRQSA